MLSLKMRYSMQQSLLMKVALLAFMILFLLELSYSDQSCTPDRFYCLHQFRVSQRRMTLLNTTLWQCKSDGTTLNFSNFCNFGCKAVQGDDSYCLCLHNSYYCGHEINGIGWKADENSLYYCINDGLNISLIETCPHQCTVTSLGYSSCLKCQDGENYCGYRLKELGWDGYENDTLYQCRGGNETRVLSKCPPGKCHSHVCECDPGRYYCGHELHEQLGLRFFESRRTELIKCAPTGTSVFSFNKYYCQDCITGDHPPHCECKIGNAYCGSNLREHGWDGYENDTLYLCERGHNGLMLTELMPCGDGKCNDDGCDCTHDKLYCGHELYQLGWRVVTLDDLYQCTNGTTADRIASCSACHNTGIVSRCTSGYRYCMSGYRYCGNELLEIGWEGYENHSLYNCVDNGLNADLIEVCSTHCKAIPNRESFCFRQCQDGQIYCGNRLEVLGWEGLESDTLYLCENGQNDSHIRKLMDCGDNKCKNDACECTRSKLYCGHQLYKMGWRQLTSVREQARLGRCTNGSSVTWTASCMSCHNTGGVSKCDCTYGKLYCGHELLKLGWHGYEDHTIYKCADNGLNASLIDNCSIQCKTIPNRPPFCFKHGQNYCGYRLKELGWDGYENDTLYQCHGGNETRIWSKCSPGTCHDQICKCNPGRYYCGHELYEQLGWTNFEFRRKELWKCMSNGTYGIGAYSCEQCISGELGARCECKTGNTYCGYSLHYMGWNGYDDDTIYLCEKGQNNSHISKLMDCGDGKCRFGAHCDCSQDKLYCGHQLYKMGWKLVTIQAWNQAWLGRCTNGSAVAWLLSCNNCLESETGSKCDCSSGSHYCGHELLKWGWNGYENDTLYLCDGNVNAKTVKTCHGECIKGKTVSFCGGECVQSTKYCGSIINQMGHKGYNNDSIYLCEERFSPLIDTGETNTLCSHDCIRGRSYCGYEIQYRQYIENDDLQRLYICNDDKSFHQASKCGRCIWSDVYSGSYCSCLPGSRYCASVIYTHGWNTFSKSLTTDNLQKHFTNDTIFQCKDEENIEYVESCGVDECQYKSIGGAYCLCSPNSTYCGHELYEHYNSMDTKLDPNYIYRCSVSTSTVFEEERCRKCLRLYGEPYCRHEFSTPWFVGGIAALVFFSFWFVLIRTILQHRRLRKLIERKRIDAAQLTVSKRLGQGEFGEVWKGTHTNSKGNSSDVALKLAKGRIDAANCFLQEVMTLDIVSHENIIKVFGACLNFIDEGGNSVPALVLEFMNGGSSISYMRSERNRLNGQDLLRIFQDICQAGDHLCKLGFIHRDIAARNVLVQNNPQTGHVTVAKLTDFGLAKDIGKLASMYKDTNHDQTKLPFRYLAPEGFERCFCFKSDVWSFGVFMWELYTVMEEEDVLAELRLEQGRSGPVPYSELSTVADVLAEACSERQLNQPKTTPEKMYKIMRQCWGVKSETRPTFEELINSFTLYGNGNIIEPPVTFLPAVSSDKDNGARKGKENNDEEKDNQHDQDTRTYAAPN